MSQLQKIWTRTVVFAGLGFLLVVLSPMVEENMAVNNGQLAVVRGCLQSFGLNFFTRWNCEYTYGTSPILSAFMCMQNKTNPICVEFDKINPRRVNNNPPPETPTTAPTTPPRSVSSDIILVTGALTDRGDWPSVPVQVTNHSTQFFNFVAVECAFLDRQGNLLGSDSGMVENLSAGDTGVANVTLLHTANATNVRCRVSNTGFNH
jgi:hypothetical protein